MLFKYFAISEVIKTIEKHLCDVIKKKKLKNLNYFHYVPVGIL